MALTFIGLPWWFAPSNPFLSEMDRSNEEAAASIGAGDGRLSST